MTLKLEAPQGFPVDELYQKLVAMGSGRSDRNARQVVAALVLLLMNHIGDASVIEEAIKLASTIPVPAQTTA